MNYVVIEGQLVNEVEVQETSNGLRFHKNEIVIVDSYNNKVTETFIPIEVWGDKADLFKTMFGRASELKVIGKIKTRTFTDKNGVSHKEWAVSVTKIDGVTTEKKQEPKEVFPGSKEIHVPDDYLPF
jgi:single-stranded DNA-binding protein